MCRDNIYLIPYLYPEKYSRALQGRFCNSHKQSGCCEADRQTDRCGASAIWGGTKGLGEGGRQQQGKTEQSRGSSLREGAAKPGQRLRSCPGAKGAGGGYGAFPCFAYSVSVHFAVVDLS